MAICLPKAQRDKLLNALKQKEISLGKLYNMTSEERNLIFRQYVGKDFVSFVNSRFEQAMLSSQKKAYSNWIKQTTSPKSPVRKDMLKRVERNEKFLTPSEESGFLKDLAEMKLGLSLTETEAKTILNLEKEVKSLRAKWNPTRAEAELVSNPANKNAGWVSEDDRFAYGFALERFKQYVGDLKVGAQSISLLERFKPQNFGRNVVDFAGVAKSMKATFDDSFIGRQGIKQLLRGEYVKWTGNLLRSIGFFTRELFRKSPGLFRKRDDSVMAAIRADIFSRPNALNGKYQAAKNGYELGVLAEEAFPTNFPERIPILGRIFKASETAFNGAALRMRADMADAVIASAEKNGIDMLNEAQATSFGRIVASMTGRGGLGKLEVVGKETNVLFFSIKYLKSNVDTLTAHYFDRTFTPEARRKAVGNLLRIATNLGTFLLVNKMLNPDSVDFDPRKGRFGKVRFGTRDIDFSGGLGGLVTFASRIVPTRHEGKWGLWRYSPNTKKWSNMTEPNFGETTAMDYIEQFFEGKLSPAAGAVRDILRGQNFQGERPNFVNTTLGLVVPISAEMVIEDLRAGRDDLLLAAMFEFFGFSPTDTTMRGYGARWQQLKEKVDERIYNDALRQVTDNFNKRAEILENSPRFKRMDIDEKKKELDKIRKEETDRVMFRHGIR